MLNKPVQLHHQPRRVYSQRYKKYTKQKPERTAQASGRCCQSPFRTLGSTGLYARLGFYAQQQLRTLGKISALSLMVEDVSIIYFLKDLKSDCVARLFYSVRAVLFF
jgi:hypothetical protein